MSITAGSQFSWSKHSISMPFEFRYLSQGRLEFVKTCAEFLAILAACDFVSSIRVSHKLDSGTKLKVSTTRPEAGEDCGLWLKLDSGNSLSRALPLYSAMSRKFDISDGSSFKADAHVAERTLHTLPTCGDFQIKRQTFVSDRLSYRSY